MLENGKTREADLPKTKVKIIERKRQLLKAAGIEMETGREEGAA